MARNNIQFKGIRHSPSDITGQDGDLLECVNLVHENGELKPIEMPEKMALHAASGHSVVAVHNVVGDKIFVSAKVDSGNTVIAAFKESGSSQASVNIGGSSTKTITGEVFQWADTIGNTLIVGTDKSTHYALFKNGEYKWLGDKMPQPKFAFDFKRETNTELGYYVAEYSPNTFAQKENGDTVAGGGIPMRFDAHEESGNVIPDTCSPGDENNPILLDNSSRENKIIIRDSIRSRVEMARGKMKRANVFAFPFFVRYAVRLFDGSYVMHSAPILMLPSTTTNPLLCKLSINNAVQDANGITYSTAFDSVWFRGMEMSMKFNGWADGTISDWEDIVKSVDIFLSSEISSYDERAWDDPDAFPSQFHCYLYEPSTGVYPEKDYGDCYTKNKKLSWYGIYEKGTKTTGDSWVFDEDETVTGVIVSSSDTFSVYKNYRVSLPSVNKDRLMDRIENTNLFYQAKRYDVNELQEAWNAVRYFNIEADAGVLEKLETLPTLPDDYVSRSKMVGKANYNYNKRLLLGNLQLQAPLWYQDASTFTDSSVASFSILFKIDKPERTIYVPWTKSNLGRNDFGHYLYYPDVDCKEAIIGNGTTVRVIHMEAHTGLNGAYALMPDLGSLYEKFSSFTEFEGTLPTASEDRYYSLQNTIAMSSVANPFHFSVRNFQDLGRTKVIGIATNTLDVSYNQWGPYSVIVFCSDGIVTVPIDKEGNFTGEVEAISADVLREPQGYSQPTLAQTGQALVFLTQRGVMMIAGTRINCVSEAMNGKHFNPLTELTPANSVLYGVGAFSSLVSETSDTTDFKTFAASGFLAYDYAHDRVLLLNGSKDYQYVLNLKTGLWSKQVSCTNLANVQVEDVPGPDTRSLPTLTVVPMNGAINNYTEMYLQDTSGYLYKTMEVANENIANSLYQYGYFISRPVRFGTDDYKTITRMLNRYTHYAVNSFAKVALYGSRDGERYGRVNTLRGMSYQYYIFVAYTYLKPNERYSYLSVDFETRLTNKLR